MKVLATFDIPLVEDYEVGLIIEKAREVGLPLIAVVLHIDINEFALARGATREQMEGYALGQRVSELRAEMTTLGHFGVKFIGAEILPDDSPVALEFEPLSPEPLPLVARVTPGKKRKTRA